MQSLLSRKFLLASFSQAAGAVALFTDKLSGVEFVSLTTVVLAAYGAANIMAERNGK